jgi:hypothetical protein
MDLRGIPQPVEDIRQWMEESPQTLVWAEGETPAGITGYPRHELRKTDTLIIYTAPPSQAVLEEIIHQTKPKKILVLGHPPGINTPGQLKERVAGLAKYAVNHKDGEASLVKLGAACAVDMETVRLCLQYWEAKGELLVHFEGDLAHLELVDAVPDLSALEIYETIIKSMVEEIKAYRAYFIKADLESLFPTIKTR